MGNDGLSDKEAALIASAKRAGTDDTAREPATAPAAAPVSQPAPTAPTSQVPPESRPEVAARIAALMAAELEGKERRRKKLRQIGIIIPAMVISAAILWVVAAILRHVRL